jgi:ribosomal protein L31
VSRSRDATPSGFIYDESDEDFNTFIEALEHPESVGCAYPDRQPVQHGVHPAVSDPHVSLSSGCDEVVTIRATAASLCGASEAAKRVSIVSDGHGFCCGAAQESARSKRTEEGEEAREEQAQSESLQRAFEGAYSF